MYHEDIIELVTLISALAILNGNPVNIHIKGKDSGNYAKK